MSAELGYINKNTFPTKEVWLPLHYSAAVTGFERAVVTCHNPAAGRMRQEQRLGLGRQTLSPEPKRSRTLTEGELGHSSSAVADGELWL